ncbi:MAG: hypothetical protein ABSD03_14265 [Vulcanimicrobiaceae bacterium]|jgi:hypothetical protein
MRDLISLVAAARRVSAEAFQDPRVRSLARLGDRFKPLYLVARRDGRWDIRPLPDVARWDLYAQLRPATAETEESLMMALLGGVEAELRDGLARMRRVLCEACSADGRVVDRDVMEPEWTFAIVRDAPVLLCNGWSFDGITALCSADADLSAPARRSA